MTEPYVVRARYFTVVRVRIELWPCIMYRLILVSLCAKFETHTVRVPLGRNNQNVQIRVVWGGNDSLRDTSNVITRVTLWSIINSFASEN